MVLPDYSNPRERQEFQLSQIHSNFGRPDAVDMPLDNIQLTHVVQSLAPELRALSDLATQIIGVLGKSKSTPSTTERPASDGTDHPMEDLKTRSRALQDKSQECLDLLAAVLPHMRFLTDEAEKRLIADTRSRPQFELRTLPALENIDPLIVCAQKINLLKYSIEYVQSLDFDKLHNEIESSGLSYKESLSMYRRMFKELRFVIDGSRELSSTLPSMLESGTLLRAP